MHRISALVVTLLLSTALCFSAHADHCWDAPVLAAPFGELFKADSDTQAYELPSGCPIVVSVPAECQGNCLHPSTVKLVSEGEEVTAEIVDREGFEASREFGCGYSGYGEHNFSSGIVSYTAYELRPTEPLVAGTVVALQGAADATVLRFTVSEAATCDEATPEPESIAPCSPGVHTCLQAHADNQAANSEASSPQTAPGDVGVSTDSADAEQGGCHMIGATPTAPVLLLVLLGLAMVRRRTHG